MQSQVAGVDSGSASPIAELPADPQTPFFFFPRDLVFLLEKFS